jgi:hypothetical protein
MPWWRRRGRRWRSNRDFLILSLSIQRAPDVESDTCDGSGHCLSRLEFRGIAGIIGTEIRRSGSVIDLEHGVPRRMNQWWWYSVPYGLFFLAAIGVFEFFGTSGWALGHSAFFGDLSARCHPDVRLFRPMACHCDLSSCQRVDSGKYENSSDANSQCSSNAVLCLISGQNLSGSKQPTTRPCSTWKVPCK